MNVEHLNFVIGCGYVFFGYGFSIATFHLLRRRFGSKHVRLHFVIAIVSAWLLLMVFRLGTLPITIEYVNTHSKAFSDPNSEGYGMYDGVGGNAAILVCGWIPPLLSLLVFLIVSALVRAIRRRYFPLPEQSS